jgi:hypothetical protein
MANSFLKKTCLPRSYSHTVVRLPVIRLPMRPIGALLGSTRRVLRVLREHRLQGAHKAHL